MPDAYSRQRLGIIAMFVFVAPTVEAEIQQARPVRGFHRERGGIPDPDVVIGQFQQADGFRFDAQPAEDGLDVPEMAESRQARRVSACG